LVVCPQLSSSNPTSQNLKVEEQVRILGIKKSRITTISVLKLMHQQQQTNSSNAKTKVEIHNSYFLYSSTKKASSENWGWGLTIHAG
jgi:hypothetical protein